jgi:hypothetical protein
LGEQSLRRLREIGVQRLAQGQRATGDPAVRTQPSARAPTRQFLYSCRVRRSSHIIDVEDLDAAIALAAKTPAAKYGSIEIHPMDGLELT